MLMQIGYEIQYTGILYNIFFQMKNFKYATIKFQNQKLTLFIISAIN
jgi:hypothetical protein